MIERVLTMKKWHKVLIVACVAAAVVITAGFMVFRYFIEPKLAEPIINQVAEMLKNEDTIKQLYDNAVLEHANGNLSDEIYTKFISVYNKHKRNDEQFAKDVLESEDEHAYDDKDVETSSLSAKYASHKVGVEIINSNDGEAKGKSGSTYSEERNSERTKAEDIVDAKKIISEKEGDTPSTKEPLDESAAYAKLKENMTASEFTTFVSIMTKLDINDLRKYASEYDKTGLKEYLHSRLNNKEYKDIVNLGYKYIYLFLDD